MATMTRVDSTNQAVYTITDNAGNTLTLTVAINDITGNGVTFASSGSLRADGLAMLNTIVLPLTTGIVPVASNQTY